MLMFEREQEMYIVLVLPLWFASSNLAEQQVD